MKNLRHRKKYLTLMLVVVLLVTGMPSVYAAPDRTDSTAAAELDGDSDAEVLEKVPDPVTRPDGESAVEEAPDNENAPAQAPVPDTGEAPASAIEAAPADDPVPDIGPAPVEEPAPTDGDTSAEHTNSGNELPGTFAAGQGMLEMRLPDDAISFTPNQPGQNAMINYQPKNDGKQTKLVITGYKKAGMDPTKLPAVADPIRSASYDPDIDSIIINFKDGFDLNSATSFLLPIQNKNDSYSDLGNEEAFSNSVKVGADGVIRGIGLEIKAYRDNVLEQTARFMVPITYEMTSKDLRTTEIALFTNVETANDGGGNGTNWLSQEGDYWIECPLKDGSMGTDKVSDRYIQNMHLEIPLPPGVTFVSSPLEGGTAGEKISASADKTTIFYDRDVYQYGTEIKFRMRLDYTGINNGGSDLTQKIFSDWFNLYNNSTSIKERQQFGKPWKFTGKIYGIPQELSFNDRSVLRLDIDTQSVRVWSNNNANKDYSQAGNYVINNDMKDSADNARTWFRVLAPQYVYPTHYTRQSVFTMDWGIQLTSVVISNWSSEPSGKAELIFFTNKGRKFQQTVSGQESYSVPALDTGEYVTKLAVQATGKCTLGFNLKADLMTTNEDGSPMAAGTQSKINVYHEIVNYGTVEPSVRSGKKFHTATVTYVPPKPAAPVVNWKSEKFDYAMDYTYHDTRLFQIANTSAESGGATLMPLKNVRTGQTSNIKANGSDSEPFFLYQMLGQNPVTLKLTGFEKPADYPDVTIRYTTSLGHTYEITIGKSEFANGASPEVNFNLQQGEFVTSFSDIKLSNLPVNASVEMVLDTFRLTDGILPSGRAVDTLSYEKEGESSLYTTWVHSDAASVTYEDLSGTAYSGAYDIGDIGRLYWYICIPFGPVKYSGTELMLSPPTIAAGGKTTLKFYLNDVAFNPTYAFEIDKNFDYVRESFQGIGNKYKFIEEWLPNYFRDPTDTAHYGNGLLRIRFIGKGSEAFNLFPVKNSSADNQNFKDYQFSMTLRAKHQTEPGTYRLTPMVYRSDKDALKDLAGKKVEVSGWKAPKSLPELDSFTPVEISKTGAVAGGAGISINRAADPYDIDGDGDKGASIVSLEPPDYPCYKQTVSKMTTGAVSTWLRDPKTGTEMTEAQLHPHGEVDFMQSTRIIGSKDGSDFIGYYHVPKRGHSITYVDQNGNELHYTSQFDTYITDFVNITVNGQPVPPDAGMSVFYYISPHPEDPDSDDHNAMNELNGGQDTSPNYLTEQEVRDRAAAQMKTPADILANCTMIKIKSKVLTANVDIVSSIPMKIGHKEEGDKEVIKDYFSGAYTYSMDGSPFPVAYTPLTILSMVPYTVSGTVFSDKNANSLLDISDSGIEGIRVELHQTGTDPHTGDPIGDKLVETQTTVWDGSYKFTVPYHGDYYLKIQVPAGKLLSQPYKPDGLPYEQSVFKQEGDNAVTEPITLDDTDVLYQNAGLADKRFLNVPSDIYLSVGETRKIPYTIQPDYLMYDPVFAIKPALASSANNFFTADPDSLKLTGKAEGQGTITLSIPEALDGTVTITKEITVHVEPESVAGISVPLKAEIYAVKGKENQIIAPVMSVYNYGRDKTRIFINNADQENTGSSPVLELVGKKAASAGYADNEISLNVTSVKRDNPFMGIAETDFTKLAMQNNGKGLILGDLPGFDSNSNWGQFTFSGAYDPGIVSTLPADNRFVLRYRAEKVSP